MQKRLSLTLIAAFCLLLVAPVRGQLSFQFDYTYDTGFFTGGNSGRQIYLTAVGSYITNLISGTEFSAITPSGANSRHAQVFDPRDVGATLDLGNVSVAANTIVVYVGAYNRGSSTLGVGGSGGFNPASGNGEWFDTLFYRGNGSFKMPGVGAIAFNSTTNCISTTISPTRKHLPCSRIFSLSSCISYSTSWGLAPTIHGKA